MLTIALSRRIESRAETSQFVRSCRFGSDAAIFALATKAGPRMSEIRGLRVGDVDFNAGLLRFVQGYTDDGGFAAVKGYETRSVPMGPALAVVLRPYCDAKNKDALVFCPERRGKEDVPFVVELRDDGPGVMVRR
jgi:integrase